MAAAEDSIYTTVCVSEAKNMIEEDDVFILDVRTPDEFNAAHIEGATLIPIQSLKNPPGEPLLPDDELLKNRLCELPDNKDAKILVYCKTGSRSVNASKILVNAGYTKVYNMEGGIKVWIDSGYSVLITFVDELDCIDDSTKRALSAKLNSVLNHMEKGDDCKAIEKIDKFICFVYQMENVCRLDSDEAAYLIHEASDHLKDLII
jgi:rhodanese-related sulfurtransferase